MKQVRTYGRMELAQIYFPAISPRAAWKKLKSLLLDDPSTAPFARLTRRTFLPVEVSAIPRSTLRWVSLEISLHS